MLAIVQVMRGLRFAWQRRLAKKQEAMLTIPRFGCQLEKSLLIALRRDLAHWPGHNGRWDSEGETCKLNACTKRQK